MTRTFALFAVVAASTVVASASASAATTARVSGTVYADNSFELWVNGKLVATDPVPFKPFNVVKVSFRASYPMTFAIRAKDYADPDTGLEYDNTKTGDGGLIARFSNGVVTDGSWSVYPTFIGPLDVAPCIAAPSSCRVERRAEPAGWMRSSFTGRWPAASTYSAQQVGPHDDYSSVAWGAARFVWGDDLVKDNTVLLRRVVRRAP